MEGFLSKKGKRIGSRVKRYMKLEGQTLSNHHAPGEPSTWQVSIKDATVSSNSKRKKLVLELYNAKMELYTDTVKECEQWVVALGLARKASAGSAALMPISGSPAAVRDTAQNLPPVISSHDEGDVVVVGLGGLLVDRGSKDQSFDPGAAKKSKVHEQLSKSFKVIQPAIRMIESADSSDADDNFEGGPASGDDLTGKENKDNSTPPKGNHIYEETPNSMVCRSVSNIRL
jgi:hypothetical protein